MRGFASGVLGGRDARERAKVVSEVRLVKVAAFERNIDPVNICGRRNSFDRLLETHDTAKGFGCDADARFENFDKAALA